MGSGHGCAKPRMRRSTFLSSPPSDLHLELKGPLPGGFPFSYNCPVTSFMSFVKCHSSPLTTPPKGTLAPVGSAPSPALYRFPSCIIFYMTTHCVFLHGQSLILTTNAMETGIIVHCVYFCVLCPWNALRELPSNNY